MISFKNQTVTVVRPTTIVERGDTMFNWDITTQHDISGCRLQPMATEEAHFTGSSQGGGTARDAIVTRWMLFTPPGPDLTPYDRVRHGGVDYEVEGQVRNWPSPTGALVHSEVVLRRVDG